MSKLMSVTDENSAQKRMTDFIQNQMHRKDAQALKDLLNTPSGRWFLMRLLDKTKVMSDCFTGNSSTFYNEGRRKVGVDLVTEIASLGLEAFDLKQLAEREYILQQQEYKNLYLASLKEDGQDGE